MKKRIVSLVLLLCLCAVLASPFALAADDLFFVAFNDTVPLTLSGEEKPYSAATGLYVPYTVFTSSTGGITASYNANTQKLILFSAQKYLEFNIAKGTYTDETEKVADVLTTYINGRLYIPISVCTAHFGLSYSILTSHSGYTVLRFTNGRQIYDDAMFLEKAENLINFRVQSLQDVQSQNQTPIQTEQEKEDETAVPICFLITGASQMESAMEELKRQGSRAAFFLTAEELRQNSDLVRKLYAQGHTVALTVESDEANPQQALREANEQLDGILHIKSLLVLVTAEQRAQIDGWFIFEKPANAQSVTAAVRYKSRIYVSAENAVQDIRTAKELGAELSLLRENTK